MKNLCYGILHFSLLSSSCISAKEIFQVNKRNKIRSNQKVRANLRSVATRNLNQNMDCSALTECTFDGKDDLYIGDGWCDWDIGCYNSAVCGYDGGDCCEESCQANIGEPNQYYTCGMGGYVCMDSRVSEDIEYTAQFSSVSSEMDLDDAESAQFGAAMFIKLLDPLSLHPDNDRFIQRYIMAVFYYSIQNGAYGNLDVTSSECQWPGVTCNENGRIRNITLDGLGMTGTIPTEIFSISSLKTLDLSSNSLSGELSANIGDSLAVLDVLKLNNNTLSGSIGDGLFGYLSSIENLDLSLNNFTGIVP